MSQEKGTKFQPLGASSKNNVPPEENEFSCVMCGRTFNSSDALEAHIRRRHLTERPFFCPVCGHEFRFQQNRDAHARTHNVSNE
ncbi:Zinc finger and SCAN domain-containing protein 21 [Orchesella cincta]|uniref:Zinc finger and SCAN domain-containing protein 21 n=1 Tax=Orchesella cincta TaxID=48709 RepID=A0A1D2M6B8_ORCCI|nr:Zinc finger and SCAN domain-containing protein 21 [Orchesella cincta]